MKVIRFDQIEGTDREVHCPKGGFVSYRYLLEKDGLGFTMTKTLIPKGEQQFWHYKNHLEACFCVSGKGFLNHAETKEGFLIVPGVVYALDKNDPHYFKAVEDTVLICVFNPPLVGCEVHKEDGSYE